MACSSTSTNTSNSGGAGGAQGGSGGSVSAGGGANGGAGGAAGSEGGTGGTAGGAGGTAGSEGGSGGGGTDGGGIGGSAGGGGIDGGTGGGGTGGSTGGGGTAGTGGLVDAGPSQKTYWASVADCSSLVTPNPDLCQQYTYTYGMSVDLANSFYAKPDAGQGEPTAAFLRFDLDGAFAGAMVKKVSLIVTVTEKGSATGESSGAIWSVQCFTRNDLFTTTPAKSAQLAAAQPAPTTQADVSWSLPVSSVTASQPACFGIFPASTDGVDYFNKFGTTPPRLVIEYQ